MSTELRSVTVKLQSHMFEQIKLMAEKRGETISDTIRHLLSRGLDERVYQENTELIARIVREQMEQVMAYAETPVAQKVTKAVDPRRLAICRKIG